MKQFHGSIFCIISNNSIAQYSEFVMLKSRTGRQRQNLPDTYSVPKSGKRAFVALVKLDARPCVACEACFFENLRIKRDRFNPPQNAKALQPLRIFPTSYGSWKTKGNDAEAAKPGVYAVKFSGHKKIYKHTDKHNPVK